MGTNEQPRVEDPSGSNRGQQARELGERWLSQLQVMIEEARKTGGPILRDVAAKAAELAAIAAENAGPVAHKAADVTEQVGDKLAARSKDLAADLRKAAEAARAAAAAEVEESKPDNQPKA
jgi:ABC-type transporter Mla subunit MlaD